MHFHISPMNTEWVEIQGQYSVTLIGISLLFACLLSYAAIKMNLRANNDSVFNKYFWYILASLAMGYGIWSMHYIGMMALSLPVEVEYHMGLTILSIIPALLASFFAFYLVSKPTISKKRAIFSSILMGLGVCSMHFLGMFSMNLQASHSYHLFGLMLTLLASPVAFYIFARFYSHSKKPLVQLFMGIIVGCSVAVTHYVAMFSMTFYVDKQAMISTEPIAFFNRSLIVVDLTIGLLIVIAFLFITSVADKYVELRAKNYDPHTHLPNYNVFEKKLAQQQFEQIAVWEFSNWHELTNLHGYLFTEELMKKLIERFMLHQTHYMELYRIAPNQLVVTNGLHTAAFEDSMQQLATQLDQPFDVQYESIVVAALCAFVEVDEGRMKHHQLYERALAVLKMPKTMYNRAVVKYDANLHSSAFDEEIAFDILSAMKNHELYLVYQPKILPMERKVIGFETLIRWNHPRFGMLSPAVFIPILEQKDRMIIVTDWILEQVGKQIQAWRYDNYEVPQVAINIPGNYVTSPNLLLKLDEVIHKYGIQPAQIELEITETSFVKTLTEAVQAVGQLRKRGFSVALDDFGTGLSSLSYLKRMQISTLKIDKSFVDGVPASEKDAAILKAIIGLGKSLNLHVVIEGVELAEQVDFIQALSQEAVIQGYYYSKPISPADVLVMYKTTDEPLNFSI